MIEIKELTNYALSYLSLSIQKGTFVLIQGSSGSGKTTLLSIIGTILKPESGAIEVDGENIISYSDYHASYFREKRLGFITQEFHLFDLLTVQENIFAALVHSGLDTKEIEDKIANVTELSNIKHKLHTKVKQLSGGEKQRVIIARALVNDADILLCDEPTANLDKENTLLFIKVLEKLKEQNKTIILASHDPIFDDLVIVDKKYLLKDGKLG